MCPLLLVNKHFYEEHKEEIGAFLQTLNKYLSLHPVFKEVGVNDKNNISRSISA